MKKIRLIALAATVVMCFSFVFVSCDKSKNAEPKKVSMQGSWTYSYADVAELTKSSDIVAEITVVDSTVTDEDGFVQTVYRASVDNIIKGNQEKEINLVMTGGVVDDAIYEVDDDPPMNKSDKFLVFARENDDGSYTILGGPQGRFINSNGMIYSINTEIKEKSNKNTVDTSDLNGELKLPIRGISFDRFVDEVKGITGKEAKQ